MNRDLTVGRPMGILWRFCLPLFCSMLFQQLYNIADSLVAGKCISEEALAAVGNSYEITLIFIAIGFGCNIGCSVVVSQLFGAKKLREMKTAISTTLISCGVLCGCMMVLGFLLASPLLALIQTPKNIFADSLLYLLIYILGLPFVLFYNVATGIFSAMGDARTPFILLACSSVANILVDILFVMAFDWKVAGVAWATFLCQSVSCVVAMMLLFRRLCRLPATGKRKLFSFAVLKKIAVIGVPSILQQSFISVGNILLQSIINSFGSGVIAGYSAGIKLNNLVISSMITLGNGISNYTAQNYGAGKQQRIHAGFPAGIKLTWLVCLPLVVLYFFFGRYLITFFMINPTQTAVDTGVQLLQILSPFYFVCGVKLVTDGLMRGIGKMARFLAGTFVDLGLRVGISFALAPLLGPLGIWLSWPIGWTSGMVVMVVLYKTTRIFPPAQKTTENEI